MFLIFPRFHPRLKIFISFKIWKKIGKEFFELYILYYEPYIHVTNIHSFFFLRTKFIRTFSLRFYDNLRTTLKICPASNVKKIKNAAACQHSVKNTLPFFNCYFVWFWMSEFTAIKTVSNSTELANCCSALLFVIG